MVVTMMGGLADASRVERRLRLGSRGPGLGARGSGLTVEYDLGGTLAGGAAAV